MKGGIDLSMLSGSVDSRWKEERPWQIHSLWGEARAEIVSKLTRTNSHKSFLIMSWFQPSSWIKQLLEWEEHLPFLYVWVAFRDSYISLEGTVTEPLCWVLKLCDMWCRTQAFNSHGWCFRIRPKAHCDGVAARAILLCRIWKLDSMGPEMAQQIKALKPIEFSLLEDPHGRRRGLILL